MLDSAGDRCVASCDDGCNTCASGWQSCCGALWLRCCAMRSPKRRVSGRRRHPRRCDTWCCGDVVGWGGCTGWWGRRLALSCCGWNFE
jgi:hypothetical protein